MEAEWRCQANLYFAKTELQIWSFDKLQEKLYNNRNRCGADAGNTCGKSKKTVPFSRQ